jgi:hypothetical protein
MTQKEIETVLKDIAHRLVYGVKIRFLYKKQNRIKVDEFEVSLDFIEKIVIDLRNGVITDIKEILRPISSLTDEEFKKLSEIMLRYANATSLIGAAPQALEYLYSIGVDVSDLLGQGLAIDAKDIE